MGQRSLAAIQAGGVALVTVVAGVVFLDGSEESLSTFAAVSTALGALVAMVTVKAGVRQSAAEREEFERQRAEYERMKELFRHERELEEQQFAARAMAQDALAILDDVLRRQMQEGRSGPPDLALGALYMARQASQRLAFLGGIDEATRIDDQVRLLLDSHGRSAWLAAARRAGETPRREEPGGVT